MLRVPAMDTCLGPGGEEEQGMGAEHNKALGCEGWPRLSLQETQSSHLERTVSPEGNGVT